MTRISDALARWGLILFGLLLSAVGAFKDEGQEARW